MIPPVPGLAPLLDGVDHVDTRTARTTASLREFLAGALRLRETRPPEAVRLYFTAVRPFHHLVVQSMATAGARHAAAPARERERP